MDVKNTSMTAQLVSQQS